MEIQPLLTLFFERVVIATSYSAANRINDLITLHDSSHGIHSAFIIFTITVTGVLTILNSSLLQNTGLQTSLSILISKLIISIFPLAEEQKTYSVLAAVVFYLAFWSALCSLLSVVVKQNKTVSNLWDKTVPFIVLFSSSLSIQILIENQQMLLLYLLAFFYVVMIQYYYVDIQSSYYIFLFIDSIMCRAIVLSIQDYIKNMVDNMDVAVVVFNGGLLTIAYAYLSNVRNPASQINYCLGVLIFTVSQQIFSMLQKYGYNKVNQTFVITITIFTVFLFNNSCRMHLSMPILNIFINCIVMSWGMLIETWLASFYSIFEPFILYFIIFIAIQKIQSSTASVIDFTRGIFTNKEQIAILYGYEMMVITHENYLKVQH